MELKNRSRRTKTAWTGQILSLTALLLLPYAVVVPYSTWLSAGSSVFQVICALVPPGLALLFEITGGVVSPPVVVKLKMLLKAVLLARSWAVMR